MEIILDTNALMYAVKYKVDLTVALINLDIIANEVIVPRSVINELKKLQTEAKRGSDKANAKLTLQIIKHQGFKIKKLGDGHTDKVIAEYASKKGAAVITNDAEFKRRLKKLSVSVFSVRQKSYLA